MADARERLLAAMVTAYDYTPCTDDNPTCATSWLKPMRAALDVLLSEGCRGDLAEAAGLPRLDSVDVVTPTLGLLLRVQDALGVLREAGWTVSVHRDLRGNERELVARYPLRESRDGN